MIVSSDLDAAGWGQYLAYSDQLAIGALFGFSSVPKLRSPATFVRTVIAYDLFGERLARPLAGLVVALETLLALSFLSGALLVPALAIASVLVSLFCAAAWTNLARGHITACGCFGDPQENISARTVGRLVGLLAAVLVLAAVVYANQVSVTTVVTLVDNGPSALAYLIETLGLSSAMLLGAAWLYVSPDLVPVLRTVLPRSNPRRGV